MARAGLHWTVRELASRSGVTAVTITRIENGQSGGQADTVRKLQRALEQGGAEFLEGDKPGVRVAVQI